MKEPILKFYMFDRSEIRDVWAIYHKMYNALKESGGHKELMIEASRFSLEELAKTKESKTLEEAIEDKKKCEDCIIGWQSMGSAVTETDINDGSFHYIKKRTENMTKFTYCPVCGRKL